MSGFKRISTGSENPAKDWENAPIGDLIDHLLVDFHRPLDADLPRIAGLARKVLSVHGEESAVDLAGICSTFVALKDELATHMMKEERILFPMIRSGRGVGAQGPIRVMNHDHDTAITALQKLRALTNEFVAPYDACESWRALWSGLAAFEEELHEHIRLETDILFPRALQG